MRVIRQMLPTLLLALVLSGCGGFAAQSSWDPFASRQDRQIGIRVENPTQRDVSVTAVAPGRRIELGMVGSRSSQQYRIPWSQTQDIRFQLDPIGGRRHITPPTTVSPGDRIEVWLQDPLERSVVRR